MTKGYLCAKEIYYNLITEIAIKYLLSYFDQSTNVIRNCIIFYIF